jgi:hypothetical protein
MKLNEIGARLENYKKLVPGSKIIIKNHLEALQRGPMFKLSGFKFALFPWSNFNARTEMQGMPA